MNIEFSCFYILLHVLEAIQLKSYYSKTEKHRMLVDIRIDNQKRKLFDYLMEYKITLFAPNVSSISIE